jgi:hypothetical protein
MRVGLFFVVALFGLVETRRAAEPDAKSLEERFPLLAQLSIPKEQLPKGCTIPENPIFPIEGVKNRQVTTDPRAFILLDEELTEPFKPQIQAAYYAVYEEGNELGIVSWAFDKPESAKAAHEKLKVRFPDRFRFWVKYRYLIALWRDQGTSDACLKTFEEFIQKKVDAFKPPMNP